MPLRIVFDARRIRDFGIGTYIRNLISSLGALDQTNQYFLITAPDDTGEIPAVPANFETVPYTGTENRALRLIAFPYFLRQFRADLFHIPVNGVPVFMPKPYIVTVHDMSTILFAERRSGWRDELKVHWFRRGLLRADRVISVSNATRRDVQNRSVYPPAAYG